MQLADAPWVAAVTRDDTRSIRPYYARLVGRRPGEVRDPRRGRGLHMSVDIRMLRVLAALDEGEFMATFSQSDDLQKAEFRGANLSGARFAESNLSGVVLRGVDIAGSDIDAPWLFEDGSVLRVNGVDVAPFVDAELNRRFPGRAERRAADPDGLRAAWAAHRPTGARKHEQ
jgi:hypothetical protein